MLNLQNLFSSKYYNIIIVLFLVITFTITLYTLIDLKNFKYTAIDNYETYLETHVGEKMPVINLSDITPSDFNTYVKSVHPKTVYMDIDYELNSMSNDSQGSIGIIDEETSKYVPNGDTTEFHLDFILYYSNSKKKSTFKPILIKKIKTSVSKLHTSSSTVINLTFDNINFKYYFIGVKLSNIDINKKFKLNKFEPSITFKTITFKK